MALAQTYDLQMTSLKIALCVAVISVLLAIPGALAFARYDWRGRKFYQRFLLLPVFFPQSVLGLALLLVSLSAMGFALPGAPPSSPMRCGSCRSSP